MSVLGSHTLVNSHAFLDGHVASNNFHACSIYRALFKICML